MSHGLLPYGLMLARLHLPFYRAGFNVVQWDMPGFGMSGGARGGHAIPQIIQVWKDLFNWTQAQFGDQIYAVGFAEDGVTCYYANANNPALRALSMHIITEYGDPSNVHWLGPNWWIRIQSLFIGLGSRILPHRLVPAENAIPWNDVFGRPEDAHFRRLFEADPLRIRSFELGLAYSMMKPMKPAVPFEQCRTPVQLIASELSQIWPYAMCLKYFKRLGGPKELVTLVKLPHWVFNGEFDETFCAHAIRWFKANGAEVEPFAATAAPSGAAV
jgi:pimeloyl-ACP methyl ester carboxylesterase